MGGKVGINSPTLVLKKLGPVEVKPVWTAQRVN